MFWLHIQTQFDCRLKCRLSTCNRKAVIPCGSICLHDTLWIWGLRRLMELQLTYPTWLSWSGLLMRVCSASSGFCLCSQCCLVTTTAVVRWHVAVMIWRLGGHLPLTAAAPAVPANLVSGSSFFWGLFLLLNLCSCHPPTHRENRHQKVSTLRLQPRSACCIYTWKPFLASCPRGGGARPCPGSDPVPSHFTRDFFSLSDLHLPSSTDFLPWTHKPTQGWPAENQTQNPAAFRIAFRWLLLPPRLLPGPNFLEEQGEFAASISSALPLLQGLPW